jgi:hypothetical protein
MKAYARTEIEKLPDVTRTWIEWVLEGGLQSKTLVVEVNFSTDPNEGDRNAFEELIDRITRIVNNSPMTIHRVVIRPK